MLRKLGYSFLLFSVAAIAYMAGSWRAPRETVSAADAEATRTLLYYQCPMHPDIRSEHATTPCGLCGMALDPVYSGSPAPVAAEAGRIGVSLAQQQLIGVKIGTVENASGTATVRVFGRVTPEETRVYRLTAGLEGYVSDVSAVTTGSYAKKNQWLATYSAAEARVPIAAYITSVNVLEREEKNGHPDPAGLAAAQTSVSLAVDRLLGIGMSRPQIEELRHSRLAGTTIKMTAPADGFVLARTATAGQRFDAGTELFQIADLQRVWILADLPVADADRVTPGTEAEITVGGRPTGVRARVSRKVLPQFDAETQTFKLRLEADNPGFVLRPDMFVDVDFQIPYPPTLVVPAEAIVVTGLHNHVFVEQSPGVFEPREVELGRRHGDRVAIVKGLSAGDRIATSGVFLLDSESRMKAAHDRPQH